MTTLRELPSSSDDICLMKDNEHYLVRKEQVAIVGRTMSGYVKQLDVCHMRIFGRWIRVRTFWVVNKRNQI